MLKCSTKKFSKSQHNTKVRLYNIMIDYIKIEANHEIEMDEA